MDPFNVAAAKQPSEEQSPPVASSSKTPSNPLTLNLGPNSSEMNSTVPTFQNCTFVIHPTQATSIPRFPVNFLPHGIPSPIQLQSHQKLQPSISTQNQTIPLQNNVENTNSVDMWGGIPDEAWISADTTIQQKTSSYYSQKIYTASPTPNTEIRQYRHHYK